MHDGKLCTPKNFVRSTTRKIHVSTPWTSNGCALLVSCLTWVQPRHSWRWEEMFSWSSCIFILLCHQMPFCFRTCKTTPESKHAGASRWSQCSAGRFCRASWFEPHQILLTDLRIQQGKKKTLKKSWRSESNVNMQKQQLDISNQQAFLLPFAVVVKPHTHALFRKESKED